jgi:hypothetical protein
MRPKLGECLGMVDGAARVVTVTKDETKPRHNIRTGRTVQIRKRCYLAHYFLEKHQKKKSDSRQLIANPR